MFLRNHKASTKYFPVLENVMSACYKALTLEMPSINAK